MVKLKYNWKDENEGSLMLEKFKDYEIIEEVD